jgi:hypothetical protein
MHLPEDRPQSPDARGLVLTGPYLAAVALLALNDHWWKRAVPGLVTGKLSDFAGVFAAAVFVAAFRPRWSLQVCTVVGIMFFFWKTPWLTPLLERWNGLHLYSVGRAVDPSDLSALVMLPLAYWYVQRRPVPRGGATAVISISVLSLLCFAATSPSKYQFEVPADHALRRMRVPQRPEDIAHTLRTCGFDVSYYEGTNAADPGAFMVIGYETRALGWKKREMSADLRARVTPAGTETELTVQSVAVIWQSDPVDEKVALDDLRSRLQPCLHK